MKRLFLTVSMIALAGCASFGARKTVSRWAVLEKASSADCAAWPLRSGDLRVDEIRFVDGDQAGFVVSGRRRDGGAMHYWAAFSGSVDLDPDEFVNIPLGRNAIVAGGGSSNSGPYILALQPSAKGSVLEVRAIRNNVVALRVELGQADVTEAWTAPGQSGTWITYRRADDDVYVALVAERPKLSGLPMRGVVFREVPAIVDRGAGGAVAIRREKSGVVARVLEAGRDSGQDLKIPLEISQDLESWSAGADATGLYLAYIDGDSLVGRAQVRLVRVGLNGSTAEVSAARSLPLVDVHASEPLFAKAKGEFSVLLMQWVDEESTLARYRIRDGALAKPKYSGIFPKGARIIAAFEHEKGGDLFVVVRHKDEEAWGYSICEI